MKMSSVLIVATVKICISEEVYVAETKLLLCRKSLFHPFYVYYYIYVCFDVCVHFFTYVAVGLAAMSGKENQPRIIREALFVRNNAKR